MPAEVRVEGDGFAEWEEEDDEVFVEAEEGIFLRCPLEPPLAPHRQYIWRLTQSDSYELEGLFCAPFAFFIIWRLTIRCANPQLARRPRVRYGARRVQRASAWPAISGEVSE